MKKPVPDKYFSGKIHLKISPYAFSLPESLGKNITVGNIKNK